MAETPFNSNLIAGRLASLERLEAALLVDQQLEPDLLEAMVLRTESHLRLVRCAKSLLEIRKDPGHVKGCECPICTDADAALMDLQANDR